MIRFAGHQAAKQRTSPSLNGKQRDIGGEPCWEVGGRSQAGQGRWEVEVDGWVERVFGVALVSLMGGREGVHRGKGVLLGHGCEARGPCRRNNARSSQLWEKRNGRQQGAARGRKVRACVVRNRIESGGFTKPVSRQNRAETRGRNGGVVEPSESHPRGLYGRRETRPGWRERRSGLRRRSRRVNKRDTTNGWRFGLVQAWMDGSRWSLETWEALLADKIGLALPNGLAWALCALCGFVSARLATWKMTMEQPAGGAGGRLLPLFYGCARTVPKNMHATWESNHCRGHSLEIRSCKHLRTLCPVLRNTPAKAN